MDGRPELGRDGLLTKLTRMLEAQRIVFAQKDGAITDERQVPDNSTQMRALNMAFALRDEYPHHSATNVNVGVSVVMERLPDLTHLPVHELQKLAALGEHADAMDAEVVEPGVSELAERA